MMPDDAKLRRKRGTGGTDGQASKKVKACQVPNFPIHAFADEHKLAASDSDGDQANLDLGDAWWQEVESPIDADEKADRDWWSEVENAIQADDVSNSILCSASGVEGARDGRERETFRCTGAPKRLKTPG